MKELINRFVRNLTIYTAGLVLAGMVFSYITTGLISKYWPLLLLLFAGITLTLVTLLFSASEKKYSRFSKIGAFAFKFPAEAISFSITLLVFYLLYLAFEIIWLLKLQQFDKKE